jgi:acetyltransferase-like isoleucine patch superfamily enzyme
MSFGKYSYTFGDPRIHWESDNAKLKVGKFCSISPDINIYLGGNHRTDWVTTYPFGHIYQTVFHNYNGEGHPATKGNVIIGNDVWIANNVTIMSGVTVGDGAVIANNSHVVKNVEPYSIVGGNPAKIIKFRFTPDEIEKLLIIKWWDWDDQKINQFLPLLCNNHISEFIKTALESVDPS